MKPRAQLSSAHPTESPPQWDGASVVDVADLLLLAFVRRDSASMTIEPAAGDYRVVVDDDVEHSLAIPGEVGEGIAARLAILTGIDLVAPEDQIGRLRFSVPTPTEVPEPTEIIALGRGGARGLSLEVRRLASVKDYAIVRDVDVVDVEGVPAAAGRADTAYEIHRELGRGGMAVVYLGTHRLLEKRVAIKILNANAASNPALAGSLIREGRAASRVRHPGVVGVTDFGTTPDGRAYLVMEYVESRTLSDALRGGPFPPVRALRVARAVADALEAVRAADVVHGDVKPSNIFLLPNDQIQLVDFGAARVIGAPTAAESKIFIGTPGYLAPECVRGEPADHRVDVYALGCVIYRMISGIVPFHAGTVARDAPGPRPAPPPRTSRAGGELLSPVDALIARALAKKAEDRYPSAGAMRDEIDRAIAHLLSRADEAPHEKKKTILVV